MILVDMGKNPPDVTIVESKKKTKMDNKCPMDSQYKCDQIPRDCDLCALGELEHIAWAAQQDYIYAVNKYIEKLQKEKKNE